jgi:hypothetical protein
MQKVDYEKVWQEADQAFAKAFKEVGVPQVIVGSAVGLSDKIDYSKPTYVIDGLCGFAWVNVRNGRSSFAKWVKANRDGYKSYYGGVDIWSSRFSGDNGQSMMRKEAGCKAAAAVFNKYGLEAFAMSRLD